MEYIGRSPLNRRLLVILFVITLDAIGFGLIFPVLPPLLRAVTHKEEVSLLYGVVLALYSFMQFVFSPVLGAMSDRYGRRPVLLASIAGATVDYLVMGITPLFSVLLVGRAIAGLTSANLAVATAYISDITEESERAKRFGYMSACFGAGFIIGPTIGGALGDTWLRGPFFIAAALNGANFVLVYFILPESRAANAEKKPLSAAAFNPLGPIRWALGIPALVPLLGMVLLVGLVGNIPGTVWVLYGEEKFHWSAVTVGLSLAMFGTCHAGAQALLVGPLTKRLGELMTIVVGTIFDASAFVIVGVATHGWVAFAIAPLFALGGVGPPAVQSLATRDVGEDKQGQLQGVIASAMSLTAIVGPLVGTALYASTKATWIGAVWVCGAAMYALMIPLLLARKRRA
jgi:DHA1 family tetracycline resistance protein-like MFS transporter